MSGVTFSLFKEEQLYRLGHFNCYEMEFHNILYESYELGQVNSQNDPEGNFKASNDAGTSKNNLLIQC